MQPSSSRSSARPRASSAKRASAGRARTRAVPDRATEGRSGVAGENSRVVPVTSSAERVAPSLAAVAAACQGCRNCPLYRNATQAVFGEGGAGTAVMLVGEQPGNDEDLDGRPFVGPAGRLLGEALAAAGLPREDVYVTNAVKHFSFIERGKRRLHKKPTAREVMACKPWLVEEIGIVKPRIIVTLGATAAYSLYGSSVRLTRDRGQLLARPLAELGGMEIKGLLTFHPSAILRTPSSERRREMRELLVADLTLAAREGARRRARNSST